MLQNDADNPWLGDSLQNIRDMQIKLLSLKSCDTLKRVNFKSEELKQSQTQANPVQNQQNENPIPDEQPELFIPIANFHGSQSCIFSQGEKINSMHLSQVIHLQIPNTRDKIQQHYPQQNQLELQNDEMQVEDNIQDLQNLQQKFHYQHHQHPEIKLVSLYRQVQLKQNNVQKLLAMISIKAEDAIQTKEIPQVGVDLICLIDRSKSMKGDRIETVKQCLNLLLEFLSEKDRLCLIVFNSSSDRLCSFKSCSLQNKVKIRQIIQKIYAKGSTYIGSSTQLAIQQIQERKFKNNVTSVFLLSDGEDNKAYENVQNQLEQIDDPFTIQTFGFGSDHDAKMMSKISSLRNGAFYFVNEIQLLDEYFVNALGSLVGVFYDKINIRIEVMQKDIIQNASIYKIYGHMWKPIKNNKIYNIDLQYIAQGQKKDYLFKLEFPQIAEIADVSRQQTVIRAIVKMRNINTNQILQKEVLLQVEFYDEFGKQPMLEQKEDEVEIQYYRVKSANVIAKANQLCKKGQFKKGQQILNGLIEKIQNNQAIANKLKAIVEDLKQAIEAAKPSSYSNIGSKQMNQICSNNLNQAGQNSRFDINLMQQSQPIKGMYDTQAQDLMRVSLMARKSQK